MSDRKAAISILLAGVIAFLLGACAGAQGPSLKAQFGGLPKPPPDQGRIYFYRTDFPWMVAVEPDVIVNGRKVGTAQFDRFFYKDAKPGRYEVFLTSDPDKPVYFTVAPGESRFVKTVVRFALTGTKLTPAVIEAERGRNEVENLKTTTPAPAE